MKRSQLLDLLARVAALQPDAILVATGSQAMHGYANEASPAVEGAAECEVLLFGGATRLKSTLEEEFGKDSFFAAEHRVWIRTLGLVSIALPPGWKERIVPFDPDVRLRNIRALEAHDYAAALLTAGNEEDFALIVDLFRKSILAPGVLHSRALAFKGNERQIQKLLVRLEKAGLADDARRLSEIAAPAENTAPPDQLALFFDGSADPAQKTGLDTWREEQSAKLNQVAASLGLPIGKRAEVILRNGVQLQGKLILCDHKIPRGGKLRSEDLLLRIDCVDFRASEIESCVRAD